MPRESHMVWIFVDWQHQRISINERSFASIEVLWQHTDCHWRLRYLPATMTPGLFSDWLGMSLMKMMKNNGVLNLHLPIVNLRSDGQEYPLWIHKPCCGRQQEYLSNKWGKRSIFGTFQILLFSPRRHRIPFSPSLPMLCLQNNSASVPWPCNGRLSWKYVLFSPNAMAQLLIVQMRGRSPRTQQHEYNYCTQMSVHV